MQTVLNQGSGLLGVWGYLGDLRVLLGSDDARAREAVERLICRAAREIGSDAAALGGVDGMVFTGGIGENAAPIQLVLVLLRAASVDRPVLFAC